MPGDKTRIYILLTILCVLILTLILQPLPQGKTAAYHSREKSIPPSIDIHKLQSPVFIIATAVYLAFFLFGIFNLVAMTIKLIRRASLFPTTERFLPLNISGEKAAKFVFCVALLYLVFYLGGGFLLYYTRKNPHNILHLFIRPSYFYFIVTNIILSAAVIVVALRFIPPGTLKIKPTRSTIAKTIELYSATLVIIYITSVLLAYLGGKLHIPPSPQPVVNLLLEVKSKPVIALFAIEISLIAPLSEELFFRAFLYSFLRNRTGVLSATLVTSTCFALLHQTLYGFFIIFIISVMLCYIYEKTHSISCVFLFHSLHNTISFVAILLFKSLVSG